MSVCRRKMFCSVCYLLYIVQGLSDGVYQVQLLMGPVMVSSVELHLIGRWEYPWWGLYPPTALLFPFSGTDMDSHPTSSWPSSSRPAGPECPWCHLRIMGKECSQLFSVLIISHVGGWRDSGWMPALSYPGERSRRGNN